MSRAELPDLENEPLAVKTLFPDPEYFKGWSETQEMKEKEVKELLENENHDIFGITHTDADGYGCEVMLREAYPDKSVTVITAAESGPLRVQEVGKYIQDYISNDTPIFIMDLAPNKGDGSRFIEPFRNYYDVTVIDHHEWDEQDQRQVEWESEVIRDTDRCATQIVHDVLIEDPRPEITALANLTADHDLWLKEDRERSDALSDLSYESDRDEYVELARKHGDLVIESERGNELITNAQETRKKKTEFALNRTTYHNVNGFKLAIAYGSCNSSDVGEKLYTNHEADLACVIFPNGKLSFRSPEDTPIARDIAVHLGGGGHKCAAGAKPNFVGSKVSHEVHWTTKGSKMREFIVEEFEEVSN